MQNLMIQETSLEEFSSFIFLLIHLFRVLWNGARRNMQLSSIHSVTTLLDGHSDKGMHHSTATTCILEFPWG